MTQPLDLEQLALDAVSQQYPMKGLHRDKLFPIILTALRAAVAQSQAELDDLRSQKSQWLSKPGPLGFACPLDYFESLKLDAEMLDFVQNEFIEIQVTNGIWLVTDWAGIRGEGSTLREAIQSAMKDTK